MQASSAIHAAGDQPREAVSFERAAPAIAPARRGCNPIVAWSIALASALAVMAAGRTSGTSSLVVTAAAIFLFIAVGNDVRSYRIPNLLTLPALAAALVVSPWCGATSGPFEAMLGAATGFALLLLPYAVGGMGAGDVKALMALGAWLGPETTLGATAWALLGAGAFGVTLLALRGELADFFRRWGRIALATSTLRRLVYEPPAARGAAAGGIPFAAAVAFGLAVQWLEGLPW